MIGTIFSPHNKNNMTLINEINWNLWKDDSSPTYLFAAYNPDRNNTDNDIHVVHRSLSQAWLDSTELIACDVLRNAVDDDDDTENELRISSAISGIFNNQAHSNMNSASNSDASSETGDDYYRNDVKLPDNYVVEKPWDNRPYFVTRHQDKSESGVSSDLKITSRNTGIYDPGQKHIYLPDHSNRNPERKKVKASKMTKRRANDMNKMQQHISQGVPHQRRSSMTPSTTSLSSALSTTSGATCFSSNQGQPQQPIHPNYRQQHAHRPMNVQYKMIPSHPPALSPPPALATPSPISTPLMPHVNGPPRLPCQVSIRPGINNGTGVFQPLSHLMQSKNHDANN